MPNSGNTQPELVVVDNRDVFLGIMTFVMMLCTVGLLVFTVLTLSSDAQKADETHRAVCTYRAGLLDQVHSTSKYLAEHPEGAPALGISRAQLESTLDRQRNAYESLRDLHC